MLRAVVALAGLTADESEGSCDPQTQPCDLVNLLRRVLAAGASRGEGEELSFPVAVRGVPMAPPSQRPHKGLHWSY